MDGKPLRIKIKLKFTIRRNRFNKKYIEKKRRNKTGNIESVRNQNIDIV